MGPWGTIVMSFFGAVFFTTAIVPQTGWQTPWLLIPLAAFAALTIAATHQIRTVPEATADRDPRANRVIARSSAFEGIAIPILCLILANTGHQNLVLSGIALIVGLHFLPMAYVLSYPRFYVLCAVLLVAASLGLLLPPPLGWLLCGLIASAALWAASLLALRRRPAT